MIRCFLERFSSIVSESPVPFLFSESQCGPCNLCCCQSIRGMNHAASRLVPTDPVSSTSVDAEPNDTSEAEYSYITHLIKQPPAVNDDSQWKHQAIHSVLSSRVAMPEAWQCMPSGFNRRKRSWKRQVILVGILGPSGAGKTSLCQRLSRALNSPFEPISTDWYLRKSHDLPRCPHLAADSSMQWNQERCYELPCCYDLNGLHDELLNFVNHVAECKKADLHPYYLRTPKRRQRRLQSAGVLLDNEPTYLIVEGFILFAEPAIVNQLNELVWLHVPWQLSCERRYKRAGQVSQRDAFRVLYKEHVHAAHISCQGLFRRNVARRDVHEIDATGDADVVYGKVLACLMDFQGQVKDNKCARLSSDEEILLQADLNTGATQRQLKTPFLQHQFV